MSASLLARDVGAGFGARTLFRGLDLVVDPGDVIGLVGANGAGKSTLLRILAGLAEPEDGTVTCVPASATVGYLAQETERCADETIAAFLARRTGIAAAADALDRASSGLADSTPGADDAYALALEQWLGLGGADLDERIEPELERIGLCAAPGALMSSLSGGQAARAGLASLLLARFDVFALDEPTNDLDLAGLDLLEEFVITQRGGVVVVSHDREFLARTVDEIVELDLVQQQIAHYDGGYQAYLDEREVTRRHAREAYEQYADRRQELGARARMQRNWLEHGVRNARRKAGQDSDKVTRKFRAESTEKQAAKARQTQRMIERLDVVEEPRKEWVLQFEIAAAPRSGAVVAALDHAVVRRGSFTLGPVDLHLDWGDRMVVTGPNGSGKTTLLDALLGRAELVAGHSTLGAGVVVGGIDQARTLLGEDDTVASAFGRLLADWTDADVRTLLAKFGLRAEHVQRTVGTLSPGERTRAALALMQGRGVNLLVLDEPTNHLDLPAIEQLEQALEAYPGTLLLVSHDRRLLDEVRVTRHVAVSGGTVREV
ncbi:MAG: ATP-binding cassette domain-containing protein [Actinomycetota bacterium]|nr:ATP-binding cassette domain-containing protein [Actinomycetota bacterium]